MIIQSSNLDNPFIITKLTIDDINIDQHLVSVTINEDIFSPFMKGSLVLSRLILDFDRDWDNKHLGFINREIIVSWTTDIIDETKDYNRSCNFRIYAVSEDTESTIKLLFIEAGYFNYLTRQFCDGWEKTETTKIINSILETQVFINGVKKPKMIISSSLNKLSYTNPNWTPAKAINFLLLQSSFGYFLFSKTNGEMVLRSLKDLSSGSEVEKLFMITAPEDNKWTQSKIIDYTIESSNDNILSQIINGIHGLNITEYDIIKKTISSSLINNINNEIKLIGNNSNYLSETFDLDLRREFGIKGSNVEIYQKNIAIRDFIKNNNTALLLNGVSKREIGTLINIDLYVKGRFLTDPRNERSGKNLITSIDHILTKNAYVQKIIAVKPGLNKYQERKPIEV